MKNQAVRRLVAATGAGTLLLAATACGEAKDSDPDSSAASDRSAAPVDASIIERAGGYANAVEFASPVEFASLRDIVASGVVAGYADGYEVLEHGTKEEGYDLRRRTVVMEVKVDEVYTATSDDLASSGTIYVTLSRGGQLEGVEDDEGGPSVITPVEEFEKSIPVGSELVVMAGTEGLPKDGDSVEVIDPGRGIPEGEVVLTAIHPQSLTFAAAEGGTTSWADLSFDDVLRQLDEGF